MDQEVKFEGENEVKEVIILDESRNSVEKETIRHEEGVTPKKTRKKKKKELEVSKPELEARNVEEAKKEGEEAPLDPKVLEWKEKVLELKQDQAEIEAEALALLNLPKPVDFGSPDLELLRSKLGEKLKDTTLGESEIDFHLTKFLAPIIEGSLQSQSELIEECNRCLLSVVPEDHPQLSSLQVRVPRLLPTIAQCKFFGVKHLDVASENPINELYCWEVENITMMDNSILKEIKARREPRKMIGQKLQKLVKLIKKIEAVRSIDQLKQIGEAYESYLKIKRKEMAIKQKEIDKKVKEEERKAKEEQKRVLEEQKAEEKRRIKEEQKRLKEEKAEEKKAKKRKQDETGNKAEEGIEPSPKKTKEDDEATRLDTEEIKKNLANQKTLTSFFSQRKIEGKKPESETKINSRIKIYTNCECRPPKLSFKISVDLCRFEKEIESQKTQLTGLQLLGRSSFIKKKIVSKKKYIFVGDSNINRGELYSFKSQLITPRNPFAVDSNINYELETEEEYEELHGEEIKSQDNDDKEGDDVSNASGDWIVPDNYLSSEEREDSINVSEEEKEEEILKPNYENFALKEKEAEILIYQTGTTQCRKILQQFKAMPLLEDEFPIKLECEEEAKKKEKALQPKIEGKLLFDFISLVHGSYWPVWKIQEEYRKTHPEISARIIKKKVKEIATKEKIQGDEKRRYHVKPEIVPDDMTEDNFISIFQKNGEETKKFNVLKEKTPSKSPLTKVEEGQTENSKAIEYYVERMRAEEAAIEAKYIEDPKFREEEDQRRAEAQKKKDENKEDLKKKEEEAKLKKREEAKRRRKEKTELKKKQREEEKTKLKEQEGESADSAEPMILEDSSDKRKIRKPTPVKDVSQKKMTEFIKKKAQNPSCVKETQEAS